MSDQSFQLWIKSQVEAEPYWFHRVDLFPIRTTPGWSDARREKLPYFGLPDDLTGMRVLDIGCAEGFFSFEAERRGAAEVVAIDSFPDSIRRFNICRSALGSKATAFLCNVYELNPRAFGTFDMVFFFGVLYHLRHPILALEKILTICTGTMLLQTASREVSRHLDVPLAQFYPFGMASGTPDNPMFDIQVLPARDIGTVLAARAPVRASAVRPDQSKAPWS